MSQKQIKRQRRELRRLIQRDTRKLPWRERLKAIWHILTAR